jgi:hypothetical protein
MSSPVALIRPLTIGVDVAIANPQKCDNKVVTVIGYLWISLPKRDVGSVLLYPHQEDFPESASERHSGRGEQPDAPPTEENKWALCD